MAMRLLRSGRCWSLFHTVTNEPISDRSGKPYGPEQLAILRNIAALAPKYIRDGFGTPTPNWLLGLPLSAAHEGLWLLVRQLYQDSRRLAFLFPELPTPDAVNEKVFADGHAQRMAQAYWKYYSCHEPGEQLTMEELDRVGGLPVITTWVQPHDFSHDCPLVRELASLCYTRKFIKTHSAKVKLSDYLITEETLDGALPADEFIDQHPSISQWIDLNFKRQWLSFYNFARNVNHSNATLWTMMLTYLAWDGRIPTIQLVALQTIAANPEAFKDIHPPVNTAFVNPIQNGVDMKQIASICSTYWITFEARVESYEETSRRLKKHKQDCDEFIATIIARFQSSWPGAPKLSDLKSQVPEIRLWSVLMGSHRSWVLIYYCYFFGLFC